MDKKMLPFFYLLALAIAWFFWIWRIFRPELELLYLLGGVGPAVGALVATALFEKREGLKIFLRSIFKLPATPNWLFLVAVGPFAIFVLAAFLAQQFFSNPFDFSLAYQGGGLLGLGVL